MSYWDQSMFDVKTRNTTGIMESWKLVLPLSLTFLLHLSSPERKVSYWDQSMFGIKTRNTTGIMEVSLTSLFNFLITFKLT